MENLTKGPFARYEKTLFYDRKDGILIIPPGAEYKTICLKRSEIVALRKENIMIRDGLDLREKEINATCMRCRGKQGTDGVFLLPICEKAHGFVCGKCKRLFGPNDRITCSIRDCCDGDLLEDLYEVFFVETEDIYSTDGMTEKAHAVESWTPTRSNIRPERILLLTSETRVTLKNIIISDLLFFKLLEKTNVSVKEKFSIFGNKRKKECIIEKLEEYGKTKVDLSDCNELPTIKNEDRFLENIRKIPQNNITCDIVSVFIIKSIHFCILPKLKESGFVRLACHIERRRELGANIDFKLTINKKKYMLEVRKMKNKSICIGEVSYMSLYSYGVLILPKVKIPDNNLMRLVVFGYGNRYVSQLFQEPEDSIWVGTLNKMNLDFCIDRVIFPKMNGSTSLFY